MDIQDLKENEYDAQLFGFSVQDFMIAIKLLVKEEITRFTDVMTTTLVKKYTDNDPEVEKVKEITKSLIDHYMDISVKPLKTLEVYLKELFHIPTHVLLPEDAIQRTQYSSSEEQEVDNQIDDLMLRIKRTKTFDTELHQELKVLRDILPFLTQLVRNCEELVAEHNETHKIIKTLMPSVEEMINQRLILLSLDQDSSDSMNCIVEDSS